MGATHVRAYSSAAAAGHPCRLVAVCDPNPKRLQGVLNVQGNIGTASKERLFDPALVRGYPRASDLLSDPEVQAISICTHTDSHVEIALAALALGKHVLVEKPVALHAHEVARLARGVDRTNARRALRSLPPLVAMPAMCMRFWPGWDTLAEAIRTQRYGPLRSLSLSRVGSGPGWSPGFYRDVSRSGGAISDLHIHDVDFLCWTLGLPTRVLAGGSPEHITTTYTFAPTTTGPGKSVQHVAAEAAWDLQPGAGFRCRYLACFEKATLDGELVPKPRLLVHRGSVTREVRLAPITGYDGEIRHFIDAVRGKAKQRATIREALNVTRVLEAERRGLRLGRPVAINIKAG
jgi:predicted dehydrogenase